MNKKLKSLLNPTNRYRRGSRVVNRFLDRISDVVFDCGLSLAPDRRRLRQFRSIYSDRIGFLIGNGPSVRVEDLNRISGQVTFCCNRFHLAYNRMSFRPVYTVSADRQMIADYGQEIVSSSGGTVILAATTRPNIEGKFLWMRLRDCGDPPVLSDKVLDYVVPGGASLIVALQLGYFAGIRRFVLYGVDHNFKFEINASESNIYRSAVGDGNHFIANYRMGKAWCPPATELIEASFQYADAALRASGGWVKNATRGGKLEVLERTDLDQVLDEIS